MAGTKSRSKLDIAGQLESIGASIDSYSANNSLGLSLDLLAGDLGTGLDILLDILNNSNFPTEEVEKTRKELLAQIKNNQDDSFYRAGRKLRSTLFVKHPYRFLSTGTAESIPSTNC